MARTRPFKYSLPELQQKFKEYKEYRSTQFDVRKELLKTGERAGEVIDVKLPKPLTILSFCLFIGTTESAFKNWIDSYVDNDDSKGYNEEEKAMLKFIAQVRDEIKDFQLTGAMNGIYNERIAARINGLNDKQEVELTVQTEAINVPIPKK